MKKISAILLLFVFLYLSAVQVFSVEIDGYDRGAEWVDAETILLLNGESNCKVNFGLIKWNIEPSTNSIYFCVMFKEPDLATDNTNVGASIKIENSDFYTVSVSSTDNEIDEDRYTFEGAVSVDSNDGVTCEIRLGLKYGIPDTINGSVRFYDSDAVPSNIYHFTINNSEEITEVDKNYSDGSYHTSSADTTTQKQEKTTKKAEKTTKNKSSDEDNDLWLLDMILSDLTTKTETTTLTTHKKSETKKKAQKTNKSSSQNEKTSLSENITDNIEQNNDSTPQESAENSAIKASLGLEKGDKYKTITLIAGAIALVAIASLGTIKSRKEEKTAEKENDPKS